MCIPGNIFRNVFTDGGAGMYCKVVHTSPYFHISVVRASTKDKKNKRHRQRQIRIASYPTYDIFSDVLASLALMVVSHSHKLFPVPQLVNIYFPVPQHPVSAHRLIFSFYRWHAIKQNMEKSLFYRRRREGDCAADEDSKA